MYPWSVVQTFGGHLRAAGAFGDGRGHRRGHQKRRPGLCGPHVPGDGRSGGCGAAVLHHRSVFRGKGLGGHCRKLRHNLFAHIQSLSFTEMDTQGTSTLITRMTSDINQVQNGLNLALRLLLRSPFVVFGAMVMAFTIDVPAALIFVVTIPLLAVVVFGVMLWTMPRYKKVQAGLDKVLGATRENLTGVRVIRAFGGRRPKPSALRGTTTP